MDASPEVAALLDRLIGEARACGPVNLTGGTADRRPGEDGMYVLRGSRRIFASAQPHSDRLEGHLVLPRQVIDPSFVRVEPMTRRLYFHHYVVTAGSRFSERFLACVREAYEVGQGAHLRADPCG